MEAFICGLALIAVSGLGYITYWQPLIARKFLTYLIGINSALFILVFLFFQNRENAYYKAINSVTPTPYISINLDTPTLKHVFQQNFIDSIEEAKKKLDIKNIYAQAQQELYGKLMLNAATLAKHDEEISSNIILYAIIAFLILIVLYWLSTIFEGIHKKEKKKEIEES
jgi:hypothetical protein